MRLPLFSAALGILAFLPINFYPAGLVFLAPLFIFFLKENKLWRLALGAFVFRLIFGLGTIYYTLEPLLWSSSLLIFMGLPLTIWLVKKISARLSPDFPRLSFLAFTLSLPFLWTIFDLLQARWSLLPTYIITAGNGLAASPFLGLAGFGGAAAFTFFAAITNALIAEIILNAKSFSPSFLKIPPNLPLKREELVFSPSFLKEGWGGFKSSFRLRQDYGGQTIPFCKKEEGNYFLYLSIALIIFLFSAWQLSQYELRRNSRDYAALPRAFKFAAISVNADFAAGQFNALKNELSASQADFIVFPEDILDQTPNQIIFFQNLARELNANLLATFDTWQKTDTDAIFSAKEKGAKKYNSAMLFDGQGRLLANHNKNRLTFLGEYWPFGSWQPPLSGWLKKMNPQYQTYALFGAQNAFASGERKILSLDLKGETVQFASPICLEIQYPGDLQEYKKNGAQFIVNPTSNRWLNIGTKHFLYLTNNLKKTEAVWLKIPIISSGVNDQAGLILPNGQSSLINAKSSDKNYAVFVGEIKF